jgi:glutaminyl-peptide cyclotransferase
VAAVGAIGALVALLALVVLPADSASPEVTSRLAGDLRVEVLETYPHDTGAFTQGLEFHEGQLYEGTGRHGLSDLRVVAYETGEVLAQEPLPETAFGEGITVVDDQIWQLTWQEGFAFRRDRETLAEIEQVPYDGEGWGVCHDPDADRLVMSNGTAELTFRDPETFDPTGTVTVTRDGEPLLQINELECVDGQVWANVWLTDEIVRIDPETGEVGATVDASGLLSEDEQASADVLNGIAAIPDSDTFLITGKLWPHTFVVRFVPATPTT